MKIAVEETTDHNVLVILVADDDRIIVSHYVPREYLPEIRDFCHATHGALPRERANLARYYLSWAMQELVR